MKIALALQVVGACCLVAAGALIVPWLGVLAAGIACLAFGIALERGF